MAEVITRPRLCPLCFGDRSQRRPSLQQATEVIAAIIGPTLGGLPNATFGNLTEMVVSVVALGAGGLAMLLGGLRFQLEFRLDCTV